jgi:hypothetical protein
VRTLFAITRDSNFPGEFPPVFPGTTTTLARRFRGSQRLSASNSGNFRANSAQFVTDSRGHRHCPLPRLFRPAGRLLPPAFPRPPPAAPASPRAASPYQPRRASRPRRGGGCAHMPLHIPPTLATARKAHHFPPAIHSKSCTGLRPYQSWSPSDGVIGRLPAPPPWPGSRIWSDRLSDRVPDRGRARETAAAAAAVPGSSPCPAWGISPLFRCHRAICRGPGYCCFYNASLVRIWRRIPLPAMRLRGFRRRLLRAARLVRLNASGRAAAAGRDFR